MTSINPYANIGHTRPVHSKLFPSAKLADDTRVNARGAVEATPPCANGTINSDSNLRLAQLLQGSAIVSVLAQVDDITLAWAGRISCTLKLSTGNITVHTNREVLGSGLSNGDWIRAKLMLARSSSRSDTLLSVEPMSPIDASATTSWLPVAAHARNAHMQRLRVLLSQMEPAMQAIFMGVMSHVRVQQAFLRRVSASDHHGYPGGLFDHSVEAAEFAWADATLNARERGIAALVCLLFDLGKTSDPLLRPDADRLTTALTPHPLRLNQLERTLGVVERLDADLVAHVRMLMSDSGVRDSGQSPINLQAVLEVVQASILQSWKLDTHQQDGADAMKGGQP